MDIKNGVDVSPFLLVEESADSEVDSLTCDLCCHDIGVVAGDEDDAESCSCDTSEIQDVLQEGFDYDHDDDENFSEIGDGDDHQRQLSLSSRKMWWQFPGTATGLGYVSTAQGEEEYSSWCGINNISRKVKDEMEDRLFWETCMALGYP